MATCQTSGWQVDSILLVKELRDPANQFSGLLVDGGRLYLLPESRYRKPVQEARLYSISLAHMDSALANSHFAPPFATHPIIGRDKIARRIEAFGDELEGLEAVAMNGNEVFLSAEVASPSINGYIMKGKWANDSIFLDEASLLAVRNPRLPNGQDIYNASFEGIAVAEGRLQLFFEYNYFEDKNYVYSYNLHLDPASKDSALISPMPFRISDICYRGDGHYVGINPFYKGGGKDTINRPRMTDTLNTKLVFDGANYHNYGRLVSLQHNGNSFQWQPLYEFTGHLGNGYNWEGIAPYKGGFFVVNDLYTPSKPYSLLVYIKPNTPSK